MFFLGWVNDLDSFYGALDINTLSSLSEAFPYALPEGARAHLATVASNVGGVPAIIEHGVTGLLIEPGDVRMLAAYLARYALDENYRHEMGEALYRRGKADFSEEATGLRQLEIYNAVFRMERNRRDGVRDGVLICGSLRLRQRGRRCHFAGHHRRDAPHRREHARDRDLPPAEGYAQRLRRQRVQSVSLSGHPARAAPEPAVHQRRRQPDAGRHEPPEPVVLSQHDPPGAPLRLQGADVRLRHLPIVYERDRQLAARVINTCVDKITLREPDSRETLSDFGVTEPEVILASDPALTLQAAERGRIDRILREHDMNPDGKYIGFVLRKWPALRKRPPCSPPAPCTPT